MQNGIGFWVVKDFPVGYRIGGRKSTEVSEGIREKIYCNGNWSKFSLEVHFVVE